MEDPNLAPAPMIQLAARNTSAWAGLQQGAQAVHGVAGRSELSHSSMRQPGPAFLAAAG